MAAPKNLQDYLKSLPEWKSASKEVTSAQAEVTSLTNALASAPAASKADVQQRLNQAQTKLTTAKSKLDSVQSKATSYYKANPEEFSAKIVEEKTTSAQKDLEDAIRTRDAFAAIGQSTIGLDKRIAKLQNKIKSGFKEESKASGATKEETAPTIESINADLDAKIADARQYIFDLKESGRKNLAQTLKDAGYEITVDGKFPNDSLLTYYVNSLKAAKSQNETNKDVVGYQPVKWDTFISNRIASGAGGGAPVTEVGISISSPTDAQSLIQSVFKSTLGREATSAELDSFTKQLNKAERSAGRKATKVGNRTEYISDLNREQFLTNEIKKIVDPKSGKSEYETKKSEKEGLTTQALQAVARLNGINLTQAQLDAYATDIRNGKDINVIKNNIRQMAGLGRPDSIKKLLAEGTDLDTIYSPYKTTMASILEVPVDQIDLNDATLQSAIGPDKEMPLYEFRKALKKDNRWQYTNNARKEVSDNVLRVLKDFGFQG